MASKPSTVRLDERTLKALDLLRMPEMRSRNQMIQVLILRAAAERGLLTGAEPRLEVVPQNGRR